VPEALSSVYLSDRDAQSKRFDVRRSETQGLQSLYRKAGYSAYSVRLGNCGGRLGFSITVDDDGFDKLKLEAAMWCRVPLCPMCLSQRSRQWQARTINILPRLYEAYPKARFIMLTLTLRNPHVTELRATLKHMHHAWTKLVKRKEWTAQGWIRTLEVTREKLDSGEAIDYVHPHFHCLLMVKPSYFTGANYVKQERWVEIWQSCLGVDYAPNVDVRVIHKPKSSSEEDRRQAMMSAVVETVKYTTKPSDLLVGDVDGQSMNKEAYLIELTKQLYKINKIATGGTLKQYYKELKEEQEEDKEDRFDWPVDVTYQWEEGKGRYQEYQDE
jgi:plasmid rolling circle replication initiator protein Rep